MSLLTLPIGRSGLRGRGFDLARGMKRAAALKDCFI